MTQHKIPLCVDMDGTLIRSDVLLEGFLLLIKRSPLNLVRIVFWLFQGKAALKRQIARRAILNVQFLPYTNDFLVWLRQQRDTGRSLLLCTAADESLAEAVAVHVGIFDGIIASDGHTNLAGSAKGKLLVERFGERGFDYCGNGKIDLNVWLHARRAVVVNAPQGLVDKTARVATVERYFPALSSGFSLVARALRVHQWAKNALIFVPLAAAHRLSDSALLSQALIAFIAFSVCASSVYLLNDLLDLEADRQHHSKCRRPFAAGHLSLLLGILAAPVLLIVATSLAWFLPWKYGAVLLFYYAATVAYSFWLKRVVVVDVLMLAALYTVRIVAGAAATGIILSFWLLILSTFLFFSLAIVKRYAELYIMRQAGMLSAKGRGYQVDDLHVLQSLGTASGYASVLVLALYLNSPDVARMYSIPKMVWLLVPLMLYWISRIWMQTHRGLMHDDPLVYAMRDRVSQVVLLFAALVLMLAA